MSVGVGSNKVIWTQTLSLTKTAHKKLGAVSDNETWIPDLKT